MICSQVLLGFVLAVLVSGVSYHFRFLTVGGVIAAVILGTTIFGFGGLPWALPLLAFFFSSSFLSKVNSWLRRSGKDSRDARQVFANGGVSLLVLVLHLILDVPWMYTIFLGSLAAVTADTWSTEIGLFMRRRTITLFPVRTVAVGTSGGISIAGTVAAIFGAVMIALIGMQFESLGVRDLAVVGVSGFVGGLVDSILGASLQVQYRCQHCDALVDDSEHHGAQATYQRGIRWLTNNGVNVACSMAGAMSAFLLNRVL